MQKHRGISSSTNVKRYYSLCDFLEHGSPLISGRYEIISQLPIHLFWQDRGKPTTLVTFSAAILNNNIEEVPVYSGWGMSKELDCNVLFVSDPTIWYSAECSLAWYAGNEHQPNLTFELNRIIQKFCGDTRTILFGASGGGFASLVQASLMKGSTAVVSNPQTNIEKYPYYPEYLELAWSRDFFGKQIPAITDVTDIYKSPVDVSIYYLQNEGDESHVEEHLEPFREKCHPNNDLNVVFNYSGEGHVGPSAAYFRAILQLVIEDCDDLGLIEAIRAVPVNKN